MARTGFGSRFLLGQRNSGLAGRALVTTFVLAIALVFCGGAVVACTNGLREVLDPRSALYRLRLPSGATQAGCGGSLLGAAAGEQRRSTSDLRGASRALRLGQERRLAPRRDLDPLRRRDASRGSPSGLRALDRLAPPHSRQRARRRSIPLICGWLRPSRRRGFARCWPTSPTAVGCAPTASPAARPSSSRAAPTPTAHTSPAAAAPPSPSPPATAPRSLASTRTPASSQAASRPEPRRSSWRWPTSGT
jgi:hypothetical protein